MITTHPSAKTGEAHDDSAPKRNLERHRQGAVSGRGVAEDLTEVCTEPLEPNGEARIRGEHALGCRAENTPKQLCRIALSAHKR
jgi:hypothetical protein